jgi:hypothetical protein
LLVRSAEGELAKRFLMSAKLAKEQAQANGREARNIRVGDRVELHYDRYGGENIYNAIRVLTP